jgi:pimeloyl-ACP methyl ester carboxylesterase
MKYKPPVVIAVHGIRTDAKWQKLLAEVAADNGLQIRLHDYGYFGIPKLLFPPSRAKKVGQFYEYYSSRISDKNLRIDLGNYEKRPSVIVHSFGSYIVVNCMLEHRDVKFDKIILCGSILPEDFDWSILFGRDQVNRVCNECGHKDFWAGVVGTVVPGTGKSGRSGFTFCSANFGQEHFELRTHTEFAYRNHIQEYWLPFLVKRPFGFIAKTGRDIEEAEEFRKTLDATHEIDLKVYQNTPNYDSVDLPRGLSLTWIEINPDIYTFLYNRADGTVKGYINAMPVNNTLFDRIKAGGEIKDNEIKASDILPFYSDQVLRMYIMSIAIDPSALQASQGLFQEALEKLLYGLFDKLIWYALDRRIRVSELIAVGWTEKGCRLCEWFDMKPVNKDSFGNTVYCTSLETKGLSQKKGIFPGLKRLLKTYERMRK